MAVMLKNVLGRHLLRIVVMLLVVSCQQQGTEKRHKPIGAQVNNGYYPQPNPNTQYLPGAPNYDQFGNQVIPSNPVPNDSLGNNRSLPVPNNTPNSVGNLPVDCTMDPKSMAPIDPQIFEMEKYIWQFTNEYRQKTDLEFSERMSCIARDWSRQQSYSFGISHRGFPRERESLFRKLFPGIRPEMRAENVAYVHGISNRRGGYDMYATAKEMTDNWWRSWGHKINMNGNYRAIGVGVWKSGSRFYGTQIFGSESQ